MANEQIADEPINKTPFSPLGTDNNGKEKDSIPQILRNMMKRYDSKLAVLQNYNTFSDDILLDSEKFMHAVAGRKSAEKFMLSEKAYLQTQIDKLISKQ